MGSTVTGRVATFIFSDGDCTQVWHLRPGYTCEKSLQAPAKKGSLEGASTCNMKLGGHSVLDKKTKVKFDTSTHCSKGLLGCVHVSIWRLPRLRRLEVIDILSLLLIIYLSIVRYIP